MSAWTRIEVELIVADYSAMLRLHLAGQRYNKAAHRRALLPRLDQRSEAAIEFKHQNISAVMLELGAHYLPGYAPMGNYQALLKPVVIAHLRADRQLESVAEQLARQIVEAPRVDGEHFVERPPRWSPPAADSGSSDLNRDFHVDYAEREARNRSLGLAGELFVMDLERQRLAQLGVGQLADRVEHVARTRCDGLGFDVLSFEANGDERRIEVKTTCGGIHMPFWLTARELHCSEQHALSYQLYRVFEFRERPQVYALRGRVSDHCRLDPVSYQASVTGR